MRRPSLLRQRLTAPAAPSAGARLPLEWRLGIALVCVAGLLMSGFFDTLMIQVLGFREVDRSIRIGVATLLTGLVAAIAMAAYGLPVPDDYRHRRRPPWEWPLTALLVLMPVWALVGAVNGWEVNYIAGDCFMLGIMPVTYFVLVRRPMDRPRAIFAWIYGIMLLMAVLSAAMVVQHNVIAGNRHKMSLDAALPPIFYIMLKASPSWAEIALLPVFLLASLVTSKRSTWLGIIIVMGMALVLRPGLRRPVRLAVVAAACVGIVALLWRVEPRWMEHSEDLLTRRWEETVVDLNGEKGSDLSATSGGRAGEIFGVLDTIAARQNPADWILGMGLGSEVQARGGRLRHHVHSTPAAFLARTGLLGLGLWLIFVATTLLELVRQAIRRNDEWHRVQLLFWIGMWASMAIFSLKSQAFWGSVMGGIQLAYLAHLRHSAERARGTASIAPVPRMRRVVRVRPKLEPALP